MQTPAIIERYFSSVRARDIDAFMALFAEDATFIMPDGRHHVGAAAIRALESATFAAANPPTPTPTHLVIGASSIAVEVEVSLPNGDRHRMGSFYHLNDAGLITRLSIYRQAK